jgi:hypothetical protein
MNKIKIKLAGIALFVSLMLFIAMYKGLLPKIEEITPLYDDKNTVDNLSQEVLRCYIELDFLTKHYLTCVEEVRRCK